jgi:hypothetical protein
MYKFYSHDLYKKNTHFIKIFALCMLNKLLMVIALLSPEEVLTALMKATTDCLGSSTAFLRRLSFISLSSFSMFYYCEMLRLEKHKDGGKVNKGDSVRYKGKEKIFEKCNATECNAYSRKVEIEFLNF